MELYLAAIQPYFLPGALSFIATFILCVLSLRLFPKWGLLDKPQKYGLKRAPIPYSGGLIMFVVFVAGLFLFMDFDKHLTGVLIAVIMIVGVSFIDDRKGLSPLIRLGVQVLAGLTLILSGIGITSVTNPFGGVFFLDGWEVPITFNDQIYHLTLLADVFTILWVVALMNVVNWLDGLPGLVSGVSLIGSVVIFMLSIRPDFHYIDQTDVSMLAIMLGGICLAFWLFDFSPPKILMGDTGTMFLGFMLAVLSIFSGGKIATALLIMGFPILDAAWVILRRLWEKKSPFKGDLRHFHHRLLGVGFTERQAICFIYVLSAVFGGVALFSGSKQKLIALGVMFILMTILAILVVSKGRKKA
jgi:UDP-GlcNAc:undecaprenyl-phosphate/decaprenyl-phosphate GlcNAc-1-phosphate transferase